MAEISDDIYFGNFNQKIAELANLTAENWNFKEKSDNSILKNYLQYTYKKLCEEGKVVDNKTFAIFNTGLFTEYYEPIYVYLLPNEAGDTQPWYLKSFCTPYDLGNLGLGNFRNGQITLRILVYWFLMLSVK